MVFRVERDRAAFISAVRERGVLVVEYPHNQVRAVTHQGIGRPEIEQAIRAIREALAETAGSAAVVSADGDGTGRAPLSTVGA